MVDSRQKGARAENNAKQLLAKLTKLNWQRIPSSGSLDAIHKLKGDLYIPDEKNRFCVEVKHYKEDHLTSKLLTDKTPQILKWWQQAKRQAEQVDRIPLLLFKFDRSKWFVGYNIDAIFGSNIAGKFLAFNINESTKEYDILYLQQLENWLANNDIKFIE